MPSLPRYQVICLRMEPQIKILGFAESGAGDPGTEPEPTSSLTFDIFPRCKQANKMSSNSENKAERKAEIPTSATQSQPEDSSAQPESSETGLNRIATSASTLLNSLLRPSPGEATSALHTNQSTKQAQASSSRAHGASHWEEEGSSATGVVGGAASAQSHEVFRTESNAPTSTINAEYQEFTKETATSEMYYGVGMSGLEFTRPPQEETVTSEMYNGVGMFGSEFKTPLQEDILQLLSMTSLTDAVWAPEPYQDSVESTQFSPNMQSTYVVEALECEDIVEFLARDDTAYTEEVWGNMLGIIKAAREEVKGKGKEQNHRAVERLQKILGQLKSKL